MQEVELIETAVTTEAKAALFLKTIKSSTAELHVLLETNSLLSALVNPSVTIHHYCGYLTLMKKVLEFNESNILPLLIEIVPQLVLRKMSQLIKEDLKNINYNPPNNNTISTYTLPLEKISIPFSLGFMYVMEGSKLGGKVIFKHLHKTLGLSQDRGANYITDYGANTFASWKDFLSVFSLYIAVNGGEDEAIEGACFAFSSIYDYFEKNAAAYEV